MSPIQKIIWINQKEERTAELKVSFSARTIMEYGDLDVTKSLRSWRRYESAESTSRSASLPLRDESITSILVSIQNATNHAQVLDGIDSLWRFLVPPVTYRTSSPSTTTLEADIPSDAPWREAFYRFLSVEPSLSSDESLLIRVLDILNYLIRFSKNNEKITEWVVPLVGNKVAALLRILRQEAIKAIAAGSSNTNLSNLNRTVFDFYHGILDLDQDSSSNQLSEFFKVCVEILKILDDAEFSSSVLLFTVFKSMAKMAHLKFFQDILKESREGTITLLEIVVVGIQSLLDRKNGGNYRNRGGIYYGSVILAYITDTLMKDSIFLPSWIRLIAVIIPSLWSIENPLIKASALQICINITSTSRGVLSFIYQLEYPTLLWRYCFTKFGDQFEDSIVKERAGNILLNLLSSWDQMREISPGLLEIPAKRLLQDMLFFKVSWFSKPKSNGSQSQTDHIRNGGESFEDYEAAGDYQRAINSYNPSPTIVSPNVLAVISKLIVKLIPNLDLKSEDVSDTNNANLPRELSITLSRVLGSYDIDKASEDIPDIDEGWKIETLIALSNTIQALACVIDLEDTLSLNLIADRQNLSKIISFLRINNYSGNKMADDDVIIGIRRNVFILLTKLILNSGQNFEDLERLIWTQADMIFILVTECLNLKSIPSYRKSVMEFLNTLLQVTEGIDWNQKPRSFDQLLKNGTTNNETYGIIICKKLLEFYDLTAEPDEKSSTLYGLNYMFLLSSSGKEYALQNHAVKKLVQGLRELGIKSVDLLCNNKKNSKIQELIKWNLILLGTLFYDSQKAKQDALANNFADALHTLFKYIKSLPDRQLLHITFECLINFTAEFPEGSQSLTLTTGLIGVLSRKIATNNSLYIEILGILQSELENLDRHPNFIFQTIELLFNFIRNSAFSIECRNILIKGKILNFIKRYHGTDIRRWSMKYPNLKILFLSILVELTVYPDLQLSFSTKIPDSIDILIGLCENEPKPVSLYALQIIRNICFHNGNKARLIHDANFLAGVASRLQTSDDPIEIECTGVALWAVTANSEKGKVAAKRSGCVTAVTDAISRLQLHQQSFEPSPNLSSVITMLQKVGTVLNSSN